MNRAKLDPKKRRAERQREGFLHNFHYMEGGELAGKALEYQRVKRLALEKGNNKLAKHCDQMISLIKKRMKEKKGVDS